MRSNIFERSLVALATSLLVGLTLLILGFVPAAIPPSYFSDIMIMLATIALLVCFLSLASIFYELKKEAQKNRWAYYVVIVMSIIGAALMIFNI